MTDTHNPNQQPAAVSDWAARTKEYEARRQAVFPENRAAVFEALERRGIEAVTLNFDGCGDSGQIDSVEVTGGATPNLEAVDIEQKQAFWDKETIETVTVSLGAAREDIAYALLNETHGGWCNNEGGFGEFIFDVPAREITLDFTARFVSCESYSHEF